MPSNPDERNALARLDLQILELQKEQREAIDLQTKASNHAQRVGEIKSQLMSIRDAMRPLLDPNAPREIV